MSRGTDIGEVELMRNAALVGLLLLLSGCSGFGEWLSDTATLPGANPNAPHGDSETMRRVRGYSTAETPMLPQNGNIWPGAPEPLPSLSDVASERSSVLPGHDLHDGGDMAIGDDVPDASASFSGAGLPSSEPDVAAKYGAGKASGSNIEIPNGDGTTTVIHPDGSIATLKNGDVHKDKAGTPAKAAGSTAAPAKQP